MKSILKSLALFVVFVVCGLLVTRPVCAQDMSGDSMSDKPMSGKAASMAVSKSRNVEIKDFAFAPATLTIPSGTEVTWINKDEEPHTVFSTDGTFKSKALDTDGEFSFTFAKPGTYKYFCSVHPRMVGTVVVEGATKSTPRKWAR